MDSPKIHRCPQCGYEYEPWVEICPDCGVLIETVEAGAVPKAGARRLDPNEDPRWTVVTNVPNSIIGSLIKDQLEDAGIPVLMQRSPSADIAQFSHNDYVPHDLRVPFNMLEDARRLLDSTPDKGAGAPYWGTGLDDDSEDEDEDGDHPPFASFGGRTGYTPEGWTLLPPEREQFARGRAQSDGEGWYRSDSGLGAAGQAQSRSGAPSAQSDYDFDEEPLDADKVRFSRPYEREYYEEAYGSLDRSRWIRVIYGILLLAISLPFLFQLLQQIVSFFNFGR